MGDNITYSSTIQQLPLYVGIIYLCCSTIFITISFVCLLLMITQQTAAQSSSFYRIATSMELADLVQLLANSVASVTLTFLQNTDDYYWLNNICSGALGCGWMACTFQAHLLSFNRFIHVYWPTRIKRVFSMARTNMALLCIWTIGAIWFIMLTQPTFNLLYHLETYSFMYEDSSSSSWYLMTVHTSINVCNVLGMIVWYGFIYRKIRKQVNSVQNIQTMKDKKKDRKTLIQAFMICLMVIMSTAGFAVCQYTNLPWWASFVTNILWMTAAGSNAVIHMTMNSALRQRLIIIMQSTLHE